MILLRGLHEAIDHMRIMLTGHRPGPKMNEKVVVPALMRVITANRPCVVVSGGADGADRLWARAAYKTKTPYEIWVPAGYYEHYNLSKEWTTPMLFTTSNSAPIPPMCSTCSAAHNIGVVHSLDRL